MHVSQGESPKPRSVGYGIGLGVALFAMQGTFLAYWILECSNTDQTEVASLVSRKNS